MKKFIVALLSVLFVAASGLLGYVAFGSIEGSSVAVVIGATAMAHNNTEYVRSLHDFAFKPEVVRKLYSMYGSGFMLMDEIRNAAGREVVVSAEEATTQIEDFFVNTITTYGSSTGGATAGAVGYIVLASTSLDADYNYYAREHFSVYTGNAENGFVECRMGTPVVTNGGATVTIPITPYDVTKTIGTIATGTELMIGASAFANETHQPAGTSSGLYEHTFEAQLFKETKGFGGAEMAMQKWVYVEGIGLYNQEFTRGEYLLDQQIEAAYLMGQPNTNSVTQVSAVDGKALKVRKIKGIWPTIDELGGDLTWNTSGGFPTTKFASITDYMMSQGIATDVVQLFLGLNLFRQMEEDLVDWTKDNSIGATDYTKTLADRLFDGRTDRVLDYGFNMFKKDGILYVMKDLAAFNNPKQFGVAGYNLKGSGFVIPMGTVKDKKTGFNIPNLQARYVGLGEFSRKRVVRVLDGMSGFKNTAVNDIDANNTYWLSHLMLIFEEANKCMLIKQIA